MEDDEWADYSGKQPYALLAWAIGSAHGGLLTLRLRHDGADSAQATLEVAMPPQAALFLGEELARQARKLLPAPLAR